MSEDIGAPDKSGRATAVEPVPVSPPRPTRSDVRLTAVAELAVDCAKWDMGEAPSAACIEGWEKALGRCFLDNNGYEIARDLESYHGVSPDAELVEILDGASHYVWCAHDKAVKAWVAENGVEPTLKVGDRISYREWAGVINAIDAGMARYLLKPDGEEERYRNGGGVCVPYEAAQAIEARRSTK